jgi:phospholipid transport system transporter-binding protein
MLLLPAILTHGQVRDTLRLFRETLDQASKSNGGEAVLLTVDGSALQHFDSSALSVLLECQRMAKAKGRAFAVKSLPPKLMALAALYGVDGLLAPA